MTLKPPCPFCVRIQRGQYENRASGVVWFEPLNPVTPGHMLFVPTVHTEWSDLISALEARHAVNQAIRYTRGQHEAWNIITSCGEQATQTIAHIHIHLVPRTSILDGVRLPWTP